MTIFLSWSGPTSMAFADELKPWMETVLSGSEVWLSTQDLDKGTIWFTEIVNKLTVSDTGVLLITRENRLSPWLHFEAGALVKGVGRQRVGTILIDLDFGDLQQPLSQFNGTRVNRLGIWQLIKALNNLSDRRISDRVLERTFEKFWPELEASYQLLFPDSHAAVRNLEQPLHIAAPPTQSLLGAPAGPKRKKRDSGSPHRDQTGLFNGVEDK